MTTSRRGHHAARSTQTPLATSPRHLLKRAVRRVPLGGRASSSAALFESLEQRRLLACDFATLGDELAAKLGAMQTSLLGALDQESRVPFLNEHLDEVEQLKLFPASVLDQVKASLNGQTDESLIEQGILGILGPTGANVLADTNGDDNVTIADVNAIVDDVNCSVSINFELGRELALPVEAPFAFGLGLPGIPFRVTSTGGVLVDLALSNTGVGFNYSDTGTSSLNPGDFSVEVDATLKPGSTLTGTFGFFEVAATDLDGNSGFGGTFTVSGLNGTPTTSLSGDALVDMHLSLGAGPQFPSLEADLGVSWLFNTGTTAGSEPLVSFNNVGIGLGSFFSSIMKPMVENLHYFTKPHQPVIEILKARIPGLSDGTNAIGIGDVTLESLVKAISPSLPPDWQTYVTLATTLIDITDIINNTQLTGANVFINFGSFNLNDHNGDLRTFFDAPGGLPAVDFSKLGQHGLNLTNLSPGPSSFSMQQVVQQVGQKVADGDLPPSIKDGLDKVLAKMGNGAQYDFPILDDPAGCAFRLLLGQDVDLANFKAQFVADAGFKQDTPYSIFGYGIDLVGKVNIDAFFRSAYDTLGLRRFLASIVDGNPQPGRLLDGLYIDDNTHIVIGGEIKAQLKANIGIAGVTVEGGVRTPEPLSLRINDPDTDGLGDDGKLRLFTGEINEDCVLKADGELTAGFKATVHVGVNVPNPLDPFGPDIFVGVSKELISLDKSMLKFGDDNGPECLEGGSTSVTPPPILAGIIGDGQLQLYVGPNAHKRQNAGSNTDVAEHYIVTHLDGAAGDEKISVTAFGYTQTFEHVKSVWADGGNENDVITLESGVLAPATLLGGNGNDALSHQGPGRVELRGWFGNDTLSGGAAGDALYGEDGDDRINTGGGNNHAEGNAGTDEIYAGDGADSLYGGTGNDRIYAGGGDDSVQGNEGDDYIEGGAGADFVLGGDGRDHANGGAGNDTLLGENDHDTLVGDAGDDFLGGHGGSELIAGDELNFDGNNTGSLGAGGGHDTIFGDAGGDIIFAQGGNDYVEGNGGFDGIMGGEGNDRLIGGSSNATEADIHDSILGEGGNDIILGDDGAISSAGLVTLGGGAGNDTIRAGAGNDRAWGQAGNDSIFGDAGDDDLVGNNGHDTMDGGAGADVMLGDNGAITVTGNTLPESGSARRAVSLTGDPANDGNDSMRGGADADTLFGQGGSDQLFGDAGTDYVEGNQGDDALSGGDDDDDLIGGSSLAGAADGADTITGGGGHDVLAGDNAVITRIINVDRFVRHVTTGMQNSALVRMVDLLDVDTAGAGDSMSGNAGDDSMHGQAGNDSMFGNDGHDDLTGHFGDDLIDGGAGDDGILGDKGVIVGSVLAGPSRTISIPSEKLLAVVDVAGTRLRFVTLHEFITGGNDTLMGGANSDYVHGGAGMDLIEGDDPATPATGGRDALFGDWGSDVINGGAAGDHIYGGGGDDSMNGQSGPDTIYGGDGLDSLWSDESGDRLIDWFGNYNNFYVPGAGFGQPIIIRSPSPAVQQFLQSLGASDGSWDAELELEIVTPPSPSNAGGGA